MQNTTDVLSKRAIEKYDLPLTWRWIQSTRENIEGGILLTGKCEPIDDGESGTHLDMKTYFLSDDDLK